MGDFTSMDPETLELILRLQLEDSRELFESTKVKGKGREGEQSDFQLALELNREDLERNRTIFEDARISRSIAHACHTDGSILTAALAQEQMAASDQEVACRLGGVPLPEPIPTSTVSSEFLDDEILEKLSALYVTGPGINYASLEDNAMRQHIFDDDDDSDDYYTCPETSTWGANRKSSKQPKRQCVACQDHFTFCDLGRAPCGHEYCRTCLQELFRAALTDDSLFPPRCCRQSITCGHGIRMFLTAEIVRRYEAKKVELETPNRTYCSNPACSSFIRTDYIAEERANCPDCGTVTCTMCKLGAHVGDCPADTALQQVLDIAETEGWQRCYHCGRLVELEIGCNHMTCTCQAQFCYLCGQPWKSCACPQWNEDRLLARANQVLARQPAAPVPQQEARLATVVQDLRDRHNCDHENWRYVRGHHRCDECQSYLPSYIFECLQCHVQACNRCRRNRL